jgi:sugar/nucleoside kinase (ribokinase family)
MLDLVSIGDIKLDVFISLDKCKEKCSLKKKNVCFNFGEKISVDVQDEQIAGSAPNVATALSRLGKKTAVVSNMGKDDTYASALKFLKKQKVSTKFVKGIPDKRSAYSAVLNLQGEKTILVSYIESEYSLPKVKTKWLYLSEMGSNNQKLYKEISAKITKEKTLLGFNPGNKQVMESKPNLFQLIKKTEVLFLNVEEAMRLLKTKSTEIKTLLSGLKKLGANNIVITDGRKGSYGFDGKTMYKCPMFPGPRIEATGAGDAFASGYIAATMENQDMSNALKWGSVNGAESVLHIGPTKGLLTKNQIITRLKQNPKYKTRKI